MVAQDGHRLGKCRMRAAWPGPGSGPHSSSPEALSLSIWGVSCVQGEGPRVPHTPWSWRLQPAPLSPPPAACPAPRSSPHRASLGRQSRALLPLPRALGGSLFLGHKAPLILCSAPSHVTRWAGRGSPASSAARLSAAGVSPCSLFSQPRTVGSGAFRWCGCPVGPPGPWQWGPEPLRPLARAWGQQDTQSPWERGGGELISTRGPDFWWRNGRKGLCVATAISL